MNVFVVFGRAGRKPALNGGQGKQPVKPRPYVPVTRRVQRGGQGGGRR